MAKIKIQDLPKDIKLDEDSLKRIAGGTVFCGHIITAQGRGGGYSGMSDLMTWAASRCSSGSTGEDSPYDTDGDGWISWEESLAIDS